MALKFTSLVVARINSKLIFVYNAPHFRAYRKSCNVHHTKRNFSTIYRTFQKHGAAFDRTTKTEFGFSDKRVNQQVELISSEIKRGKPMSSSDWEELKRKALSYPGRVNSYNFDGVAMGFCVEARQYDVGLSLLEHNRSSGKETNLGTLSRFFKLCYECYPQKPPEEVKKTVESLYVKLRTTYPLLDANSAEDIIHGLSLTDKWKEGLELLSMIELTCKPNLSSFNVICQTAFDRDDLDVGWELINKMMLCDRKPTPSTYCALLNLCMRCHNKKIGRENVEKMLIFFANNELRPTVEVVDILIQWFKDENPSWNSRTTLLNPNGKCVHCKYHLQLQEITTEEFQLLQKNFFDKALIGSNVFHKTTPEEVESFKKFLQIAHPYDVVIDGLNVAYCTPRKKSPAEASKMVYHVVKHFVDKSKKVVLLGRKHMQSWPKRYMNYVFSNSRTFLAENMSEDDPFLLYTTIHGGQGTCFVSRDYMRNHLFQMQTTELKSIFKRWQQQHQYHVVYIAAEEDNVVLKPPLNFTPTVQRRPDGGWHIPYDEEFLVNPPRTLDPPTQWLCVGPKAVKKLK